MRALLPGHGASRGSALGRARVRLPHLLEVAEQHIRQDQIDDELARLHEAVDATRREMHSLRARLHGALAQEVGEFLDLHALLLDDPELLHGLDQLIRAGRYTADYALRLQRDRLAAERWFLRHGLPYVLRPGVLLRGVWSRSAPASARTSARRRTCRAPSRRARTRRAAAASRPCRSRRR